MFEFSLPSGVEKRSSFSLMTDTVANSLSEFRMRTPQSALTHKTKRRVLQDSTNVADLPGLGDDSSTKVMAKKKEKTLVAVDSTRKPKRLRKDKAGSFTFAGVVTPIQKHEDEGGKQMKSNHKPSQPPQYSSALSRLSKTIDQGVSECMDCLSELKTKNTKYEYLLKTIKDEIKGIRDHAKTPQDGSAGANAAIMSANSTKGSGSLAGEKESCARDQTGMMKLTPSVCQNLNIAMSVSPSPSLAPPQSAQKAASLSPNLISPVEGALACVGGRKEDAGGSLMVTPCNVGKDEIKHSFQLACAQNLIGESIAAIGSGEKQGAKERVGLAIEALRSVMSEWKDEIARENTKTPPLGGDQTTSDDRHLIESLSADQRKQMVVHFSSPTERPEPQSTSRKEEKVEEASEGTAHVRTPEEDLPSQKKGQMSSKSGTPQFLNIEDVFAKAWAGASPILFQTPLPALTPLPVSTQILQGFTFPTLTEKNEKDRSEENTDVKSDKEKCVVM